jgi:hypothetical protein
MDKVLKVIFAMIEIIFFAVSTIIAFAAAAIISFMVIIIAMIYAPFTFIIKNANIAVMQPWIVAPFDLALKDSRGSWSNLQDKLSEI